MGLSAPTEVVHLSPGVVAISSRQSGFYNQLVKEKLFYTANVSGHFMVGLHFESWETMDKYHIVTIAQFV